MEIRSSKDRRKLLFALIGSLAILSLGLVLVILPVEVWEGGRSVCLSKTIFGHQCPGCGITRAISSVLHLRFGDAFAHNPMIVVVFPLLCLIIGRYLMRNIKIIYHAIQQKDEHKVEG